MKINKRYIPFIVLSIILIVLYSKGPIIHRDSIAFLNFEINRSPAYNLFLYLCKLIHPQHTVNIACAAQFFIFGTAVYKLGRTLASLFNLPSLYEIGIYLFLLIPSFYLHHIGNAITSESIAYPIILLIIHLLIKFYSTLEFKNIIYVSILQLLLTFTRGQFIVFLFVEIGVLTIVYFQKRNRESIYYIILFVTLPFFTQELERTYNKTAFNAYSSNTMGFVHLTTGPFYLSTPEDVASFKTKEQQEYFTIVYSQLSKNGWLASYAKKYQKDNYYHYNQNFSNITNESIHELGLQYFKAKNPKSDIIVQNRKVDLLCKSMYVIMLKNHPTKWIKLTFQNFKNSFGSFKTLLFYILLFLFSGYGFLKTKDIFYLFSLLVLSLIFLNNGIISIIVPTIKRYTFYFDWFLYIWALIVFHKLIKKENHQ